MMEPLKTYTFSLVTVPAGSHEGFVTEASCLSLDIEAARKFATSLAKTHQTTLGDRSRVVFIGLKEQAPDA
jgi:hypothetical protein